MGTAVGIRVESRRSHTLFAELVTRTLNVCRLKADETAPTFSQVTQPTPFQCLVSHPAIFADGQLTGQHLPK